MKNILDKKPIYPPQRMMQRPIPNQMEKTGGYQKSISPKKSSTRIQTIKEELIC